MPDFSALLPRNQGALPYWLLATSVASIGNSIGCYRGRATVLGAYQGPESEREATPLASRLFGTWTMLACVVRTYAAYRINNPDVYAIAFLSYVIGVAHFVTEWQIFGTMKPGRGLNTVMTVASTSAIWMFVQRKFYAF